MWSVTLVAIFYLDQSFPLSAFVFHHVTVVTGIERQQMADSDDESNSNATDVAAWDASEDRRMHTHHNFLETCTSICCLQVCFCRCSPIFACADFFGNTVQQGQQALPNVYTDLKQICGLLDFEGQLHCP